MNNILALEKVSKALPWTPTKPRFHQGCLQWICYTPQLLCPYPVPQDVIKETFLTLVSFLEDNRWQFTPRQQDSKWGDTRTSCSQVKHHLLPPHCFSSRPDAQDPVKTSKHPVPFPVLQG